MKTRIISVVNQKGGTGKTTTTINLGSALQNLGKKILLIDLDPQANLSYSLGITSPQYSVADLLQGSVNLNEVTVTREGMQIVPGSNDMVDIELSLAREAKRENFLKDSLSSAEGKYDYVLIDCPPSLSVLTLNAFTASDSVLIPLQMEVLTLQGLDQILKTIDRVRGTVNPKLAIEGIVVVMYDKRRKLSQEVESILHENINERIFESRIRVNVKIAEAPSFGKSIVSYDVHSAGAQDYLRLAAEFIR